MSPQIEQMARETGFSSSWAIAHKSKVIVMGRVQNLNIDLMTYRVGFNLSIHTTSLGKLLAAYLPEERQNDLLKSSELKKITEKSIVDVGKLKDHLNMIRERGYSTDEGETHEDLFCLSAPVKDGSGNVIAGICLMDDRSTSRTKQVPRKSWNI